MKNTCGICGSPSLEVTTETFSLEDILQRWEREADVKFTNAVWQQYTQPASPQVTLYRCPECGFKVFDPPVAGSSDFYKCITTSDGSCYTPQKWEFKQAISDIRRRGCRRVLDIGSGSGFFLDLLADSLPGVQRTGFEFNEEMSELIRSKGHEMRYGESPEILLGEEKFDAVTIFQVLEHVVDPTQLIAIARRLLRAGGLLLIAVPDNGGPVRYFSDALTELPPHHLSRWRASTFRKGLPHLGFDVQRIAYEPLPAYLWRDYLPVILENSRLPRSIVQALNKNQRLERLLHKLRLQSLRGVRGHSIYVSARRRG